MECERGLGWRTARVHSFVMWGVDSHSYRSYRT